MIPKSLFNTIKQLDSKENDLCGLCFQWGLFSKKECDRCKTPLRIVSCKNGDNYCFECPNSKCNCHFSIRKGSFFHYSKLSLNVQIEIFAYWVQDIGLDTVHELTNVSKTTIIEFFNRFRAKAVSIHLKSLELEPLGGNGKNVQIDESLFGHAKYHIGKNLHYPSYWCFGMIEEETGRITIMNVQDRSEYSLVPIIVSYVQQGTTIKSDQWRGYSNLSQYNYHHLTVNHRQNFVDPDTQANTQTIESNWNSAKSWMRKKHLRDRSKYQEYLYEWCFRHNCHFSYSEIWESLTS